LFWGTGEIVVFGGSKPRCGNDIIVNLHGTTTRTVFLDCGAETDSAEVYDTFDLADGSPR